jgi:hypothetical protein
MELDRKRLLALFTEHGPGTCGNCLAGIDRTAEVERLTEENTELKALMSALLEQLGENDRDDGNAPGHAHDVYGLPFEKWKTARQARGLSTGEEE